MIRYNVQEYRHLKDIATLLKEIMKEKVFHFCGLTRDHPPTEDELQDLILSFDRDVMASTIQKIETYIEKRDKYWDDWRKANGVPPGGKKRTHDRRKLRGLIQNHKNSFILIQNREKLKITDSNIFSRYFPS